MQTQRYSIVLFLMIVLLGVSTADDLTTLSRDEATGIAQVVADTFTEHTGTSWVALSPVEVKDDSTGELIGYFYLITNDLDAGVTTIEGLESEVEKANLDFPLLGRLGGRFTSSEQETAYDSFRDNYFSLVVASEFTEYPIINLEKCGFEMNLFTGIMIQWLNMEIIDTDPTNYSISDITYVVKYDDWNNPVKYLKYTIESSVSGEQLTILDGFAGIEYYGSFKVIKDIKESLRSKGLLKSRATETESDDIDLPDSGWNINAFVLASV